MLKINTILSSLILRRFFNCASWTFLNDSGIGKNDLQLHFFRNLACLRLLYGTQKKYSFNITGLLCSVRSKWRRLTSPQQGPTLAVTKIIILIRINGTGTHYLSWSVLSKHRIHCDFVWTCLYNFGRIRYRETWSKPIQVMYCSV
jgi:hypothetical protein